MCIKSNPSFLFLFKLVFLCLIKRREWRVRGERKDCMSVWQNTDNWQLATDNFLMLFPYSTFPYLCAHTNIKYIYYSHEEKKTKTVPLVPTIPLVPYAPDVSTVPVVSMFQKLQKNQLFKFCELASLCDTARCNFARGQNSESCHSCTSCLISRAQCTPSLKALSQEIQLFRNFRIISCFYFRLWKLFLIVWKNSELARLFVTARCDFLTVLFSQPQKRLYLTFYS